MSFKTQLQSALLHFILGAVAAGASSTALADDGSDYQTIRCWKADVYDRDGDGYANIDPDAAYQANKNDRVELIVLTSDGTIPSDAIEVAWERWWAEGFLPVVRFEDKATCPAGWVKSRGDCDDSDENIHPRRDEIYGNGTDDNCNGLIDEPEFHYTPIGNNNTPNSFKMQFRVHDRAVKEAYLDKSVDLRIKIEYQSLEDTGTTKTSRLKSPESFMAWGTWVAGTVSLGTHSSELLKRNTVYRARIQFLAKDLSPSFGSSHFFRPVGDKSEWYYTVTTGSSKLNKARAAIVLQGFYEYYESAHQGLVGYRGAEDQDGTRYGASEGEAWCSEFYTWVAEHKIHEIEGGDDHGTSDMANYFNGYDAGTDSPSAHQAKRKMKHGDYLGEASSGEREEMHHTSMFLAYDKSLDLVWTLGGNTGGYNRRNGTGNEGDDESQYGEDAFEDTSGWYVRKAGNEVFIQPIAGPNKETNRIVYWGKLKRKMLK